MAVNKHINFFELQKAAEKPGCPLCRIISDRAEMYIDNMLFEHVSDIPFRRLHRAAGGFCSYHSRNLISFRDGLAVAILSKDILIDKIKSFETGKIIRAKSRCPICIEKDRIEDEYLGFLLETGGETKEEQELRKIFLSSDGLCAPHYSALLFNRKRGRWEDKSEGKLKEKTNGDVEVRTKRAGEGRKMRSRARNIPKWLSDFHENKYRNMLTRISNFIELSAYGRQEEFAKLSEEDQLVWREAASALRGSEDLFGVYTKDMDIRHLS